MRVGNSKVIKDGIVVKDLELCVFIIYRIEFIGRVYLLE